MKFAVLIAALLLAALPAQGKVVAPAPAPAEELLPPTPAPAPAADIPADLCRAPAAVYATIEECEAAIAAGVDVATAQGVDLAAMGVDVAANNTSTSSTSTVNGNSVRVQYKKMALALLDPPLFCCGLSVETSSVWGSTPVPNAVASSAATPAWSLHLWAVAAALVAGAAAIAAL